MAHSMSSLDTDWLQYLADTPEGRRKQCETILEGRFVSSVIGSIALAIGILYCLYKGWL